MFVLLRSKESKDYKRAGSVGFLSTVAACSLMTGGAAEGSRQDRALCTRFGPIAQAAALAA